MMPPIPPLTFYLVMLSFLCFCACHQSGMHQTCTGEQSCGNQAIFYPFGQSKGCGHPGFQIQCLGNYAVISINNRSFQILEFKYSDEDINIASKITIVDEIFLAQPCALPDPDLTYNPAIFKGSPFHKVSELYSRNLTLFCSCKEPQYNQFSLTCNNSCYLSLDNSSSSDTCGSPATDPVPVTPPQYFSGGEYALYWRGIEVEWEDDVNAQKRCTDCESSEGACGYNASDSKTPFLCYCQDGPHSHNCTAGISLGAAFLSITAVMLFTIHLWRKLRKSERNNLDLRMYMYSIDSRPASVENFLRGYASGPTRYSYCQIRKYTNNFRDKLGQGGFGQVFKGKLPNGYLVAVKLLDNSRQSEQQFLNEVATIGRIHHIHLVRLLGYCFQKSKRALVYEYMINGSLEKYIHGSQETHPDHVLDWKQLFSIAIGTARGIAYLHEECANRILHCDIKPHNVLLDSNYPPRVADFGLAKLGKREESHMSITAARGTPGYAAPEMWSRNHGPVTDKSDVYSYGMLLLEMVGGRKNMDVGGSRSSQFYFPEWAFKQAEKGEFGNLTMRSEIRGFNAAEDENIAKKLTLIGLWCIHYDSSHRPSMVKVIQMLEGSVQVTTPSFPFPAYVTPRPASYPSGESSSYSSLN
eukprot:Gb_14763 [translate_table: standard]